VGVLLAYARGNLVRNFGAVQASTSHGFGTKQKKYTSAGDCDTCIVQLSRRCAKQRCQTTQPLVRCGGRHFQVSFSGGGAIPYPVSLKHVKLHRTPPARAFPSRAGTVPAFRSAVKRRLQKRPGREHAPSLSPRGSRTVTEGPVRVCGPATACPGRALLTVCSVTAASSSAS